MMNRSMAFLQFLLVSFLVIPLVNFAQQDTAAINLPMKDGRVNYEGTFIVENSKDDELANRAIHWILNTFPEQGQSVDSLKKIPGTISGHGIFKVKTNNNGNFYFLQFTIAVKAVGNNCSYSISDFYEKPVEKGITNEFSKIEYRWRDYHHGHPWSTEDKALFTGLHQNTLNYIESLRKEIFTTRKPVFKALALYTTTVEDDHVDFAKDALKYFNDLGVKNNFTVDSSTNWSNVNDEFLKNYQLVIWLNDFPQNEMQRNAFEKYMNNGGAWLGCHVAGYNDKYTKWPWFVNFLGGAVFYNNNWPPLPAKLIVDNNMHPVTKGLPHKFTAPINEWYGWKPNPRLNKDVKVLVTLDPLNYPLGKKDIIRSGDIPVVWTNTKYKMLYVNMGHGDHIFTTVLQNKLFENALLWLGLLNH